MTAPQPDPADAAPVKKPDGLEPFRELIRNRAALTYLMITATALLLVSLILFQLYFTIVGASLTFALGMLGMLLRSTAMPVFLVAVVCYTTFAPLGVPLTTWRSPTMIPSGSFNLRDLLLLPVLLTYLLAQFRLFSVIHSAIPFEAGPRYVRKKAKPVIRPAKSIPDAELGRLFLRVGVFTILGQFLWLSLSELRVDFRAVPPLVVWEIGPNQAPEIAYNQADPTTVPFWLSRTLMTAGVLIVLGLTIRFGFWLWRHLALNREQAKMLLQNVQWEEARREIDRQEKWRAWAVAKANGTLPARSGCGTAFLLLGLPAILLVLFWLLMLAAGCVAQ